MAITAYSCGDLFYQSILLEDALKCLINICFKTKNSNSISIIGLPLRFNSKLYNCAAVIQKGEILGIVPKINLCNSNEYYEKRWFDSGFGLVNKQIELNGKSIPFGHDLLFEAIDKSYVKFGIEICEDFWSIIPPSSKLAMAGALAIFNLSGSNEYAGKRKNREELIKSHSSKTLTSYCYSSAGISESVSDTLFSGELLIAQNGEVLGLDTNFNSESKSLIVDVDFEKSHMERLRSAAFKNIIDEYDFRIIKFSIYTGKNNNTKRYLAIPQNPFLPINEIEKSNYLKELFEIQTTSLARRIEFLNIKDIVIGVSGGLDSTLALIIAVKAFNKLGLSLKGIHSISMPCFGTSERTFKNAKSLINLLHTHYVEINIEDAVLQHFSDIGQKRDNHDVVFENSQARERTQVLMDYANKVNGIVIGTGDLSEIALGWCTYNADHIGMYNVNSSVPKTVIKELIIDYAKQCEKANLMLLLKDIIETPISPELVGANIKSSIMQETEAIIGPYKLHDFFLYQFVKYGFSPNKINYLASISFENEFSNDEIEKYLKIFIQRFFQNQFKRQLMPDGVKATEISLSPRGDWRMPSDADFSLWMNY